MARTGSQSVTERITGGLGVNTSEFRDLARDLRLAGGATNRQFRRNMRGVGELIAQDARARASAHSKTIASTIKVRSAGATVEIRAGGPTVPLAGLFELGNVGGKAKSAKASEGGTFKHPVFGQDVWVSQKMHPYLHPAAEHKFPEALVLLTRAIDTALREHGLTTS